MLIGPKGSPPLLVRITGADALVLPAATAPKSIAAVEAVRSVSTPLRNGGGGPVWPGEGGVVGDSVGDAVGDSVGDEVGVLDGGAVAVDEAWQRGLVSPEEHGRRVRSGVATGAVPMAPRSGVALGSPVARLPTETHPM